MSPYLSLQTHGNGLDEANFAITKEWYTLDDVVVDAEHDLHGDLRRLKQPESQSINQNKYIKYKQPFQTTSCCTTPSQIMK
jgi:hypothetical protein